MPHPHASATFRRDVATHAFQSSARARARPNAEREGAPALLPAQLPTLFVLYMYDVLSRFRENEFHKKRRSAWSDVRHVSRATT